MPLEPFVTDLETVSEDHRGLYVEAQTDAGETYHRLDVTKKEGWELSKTSGLVSTLEKQRTKLADYNGISADDAASAVSRVRELESDIERKRKHASTESSQEKEELQVLREELKVAKTAVEGTRSAYASTMQLQDARTAIVQAGFKTKADVMQLHLERELDTAEIDGKMITVVKGEHGHRMITGTDGQARLMTPQDRANELASDPRFSDLRDGTQNSGGGTIGGGGAPPSGIGGVRTISAAAMLDPTREQSDAVASGKLVVVP